MKPQEILTILFFVSSISLRSEDSKPKVEPSQKVYAIYSSSRSSYVLTDIETAEFHGIECLKGRHIDLSWIKDRICYLPVTTISMIIEYDSLDDYKNSMRETTEDRLK